VPPHRPSVLLLDVDGVLQFPRPEFAAAMAADYPWRAGFAAFQDALFTDPMYRDCLLGDRDFLDLADRVLAQHVVGLTAERFLDRFLRENIAANTELLARVPDWGFDLVFLATNQEPLRGSYLQRRYAGYAWCTGAFLSCRIGACAPDPAFYAHVLGELRQPAAECLVVAESAEVVAEAIAQGLHGVRFIGNAQIDAALAAR
jgi:putative hydrolase of the HAD superfamily